MATIVDATRLAQVVNKIQYIEKSVKILRRRHSPFLRAVFSLQLELALQHPQKLIRECACYGFLSFLISLFAPFF